MKTLKDLLNEIYKSKKDIPPNKIGKVSTWQEIFGEKIPKDNSNYVYHVTTEDRISSIKKNGLTTNNDTNFLDFSNKKYISFSEKMDDVIYWSTSIFWRNYDKGYIKKTIILRVHKNNILNLERWRQDEVRTAENIPNDKIDIWNNNTWKPIK